MYRDIIYTSLAKANPEFLSRLSNYDRVEEFIDSLSEFAGDAHFQIEKQIIDQYTKSDDYRHEKHDIKKVNKTLRHIDENVMKMIPDLIEQALMPGSEMMKQLEEEEDEIEKFETMYQQLFRDREADDGSDSSAGIFLEEGGLEELKNLDLPEERANTLEDLIRQELKAASKMSGSAPPFSKEIETGNDLSVPEDSEENSDEIDE